MADADPGPAADLHARTQILDAISRYCRAMDRIDDALGRTVWHSDGTVAYEPDIFAGSAHDFVAWTNRLHLLFRFTSHQAMNVVIRIDADAAVSETQGHIMLAEPPTGEASTIRHAYGRYLDRWSLRDGVWAIDHRQYRRDFGFTERRVVTTSDVPRDRSDFSYVLLPEG